MKKNQAHLIKMLSELVLGRMEKELQSRQIATILKNCHHLSSLPRRITVWMTHLLFQPLRTAINKIQTRTEDRRRRGARQ
jgi:hypothetical protein